MKKRSFNIFIIIAAAILLLAFSYFGLLEKSSKFMLIPILVFYFLGQYSERKFLK
ncbi:MAG: hypothetical protein K0B15_04970 [Lentimicrobium sp.]|nr:hypothetical protein [Lentimicrobium sp.]